MDCEISLVAYCKIIFHAAKYPDRAINGVLIGTQKGAPGSEPDDSCIRIIDSIPLFHLSLSLTPMLEVALHQIDSVCSSQKQTVVGYYQANEHLLDTVPNHVSCRIGDKIREHYPEACMLIVNNQNLHFDSMEHQQPVELYQYVEKVSRWSKQEHRCLRVLPSQSGTEYRAAVSACLQNGTHLSLVDFDEHLDEPSLDWANGAVNEMINEIS